MTGTEGQGGASEGDPVRSALEALGPGFKLVRELGRGATAIVYLVRDHELNRDLAVKVIRSSFGADEEAMARLQREAKLVAQLQHPNIVKLYGTRHLSDGSMVLLMEHVPGRNLKELLQEEGALPPRKAMSFLMDVASALAYAHRRKIVHRDVKPENIYIDDEVGTARLADFGVARPWDLDTRLTLPGESLGTPAYMAPEQIDGADVDGRSDVFSLGLVAYEMLTGAHPWDGESIYSIIFKQKHEDLPPLREVRPDLSERVVTIVERSVRKDPADRWSSAEEMLAEIRALDEPEVDPLLYGVEWEDTPAGEERPGLPSAPPPPTRSDGSPPRPTARAPQRAKRWPWVLGVLAAAVAGLVFAREPLGLDSAWRQALARIAPAATLVADSSDPGDVSATSVPSVPGPPRLLAGRGGNAQSGPVGTTLPEALRVQVVDSIGLGVPDVLVHFEVIAGEAALDTTQVRTDVNGAAAVVLTLPALPQEVEVLARTAESNGIPDLETRFLVSAVPATGAAVSGIDGNGQSGPPGQALPDALLLRVVDEAGNAVEGAEVEFSTESGVVVPEVDLTDAQGWAVSRWTLGDQPGRQEVVARITGSGVRVVFEATAEVQEPAVPDPATGVEDSVPSAPVSGRPPPNVVRRGWDVGGTMFCALGSGRPFCRGGAAASADVGGLVAVVTGVAHACGVDPEGVAWCWGSNDGGQLGDGSRTSSGGRRVDGMVRFSRLTAGLTHSCGLDGEGQAYCWGSNLSGQLGTGSRDDRSVPTAVASALRFRAIDAGWNHTCALTPSGQIECWGLNASGQLGDGGRVDRLAPTAVATGPGFQALAAGSSHTCALRDGQVFCWGDNQHGQLGTEVGDASVRPSPVAGLPPVTAIATGAAHSCALTAAGEAYCWGQNLHGQLGDGTNMNRSAPTAVVGDLRFEALRAGGGATCGRTTDGVTYCWGFNQNGQLGDGSRTSRSVPTRTGG